MTTRRKPNPCLDQCDGRCCRAFTLFKNGALTDKAKLSKLSKRNQEWLTKEIREISADEARRRGIFDEGVLAHEGVKFFECTLFDEDTGKCNDYKNRPNTCKRFPKHLIEDGAIRTMYHSCALFDVLLELANRERVNQNKGD